MAQRVQVFFDIGWPREPQTQDQAHDPDNQHDEPDRRDEPVPRTERVERGEFADADPEFVVEPGPQGDAGAAEEDQEDSGVEEELLAESCFLVGRLVVVGRIRCDRGRYP